MYWPVIYRMSDWTSLLVPSGLKLYASMKFQFLACPLVALPKRLWVNCKIQNPDERGFILVPGIPVTGISGTNLKKWWEIMSKGTSLCCHIMINVKLKLKCLFSRLGHHDLVTNFHYKFIAVVPSNWCRFNHFIWWRLVQQSDSISLLIILLLCAVWFSEQTYCILPSVCALLIHKLRGIFKVHNQWSCLAGLLI